MPSVLRSEIARGPLAPPGCAYSRAAQPSGAHRASSACGRNPRSSVPKPIVNLEDVEFNDVEENGYYTSRRALFSAAIGARRLGYNLAVLPLGKAQCPFHSHRAEEEMFLILEGEGELRFGNERYPICKNDVIACPTGGPEVAHQIVNTGAAELRYLALSNLEDVETCEYPDSMKVGIFASAPGSPRLRKLFLAEADVEYYERESIESPRSGSMVDRNEVDSDR
jgi:uncharacterized cupin superfamily protein